MSIKLSLAEMQLLIDQSLFHGLFQPEVKDINYDEMSLTVKMRMSETLERQPGTGHWHGGAISAAIDTVGCYALAMITGAPFPTINFRTDYLRPAANTDLKLIATIRKSGRSIAVVDIDVSDDSDRLIAVGRACYSAQSNKNFT